MKDLAIVVLTCDKYSHLWDTWYTNFKKHFNLDVPIYFCSETKAYPKVKNILVNKPNINRWTKRIRKSIRQIPEENLFVIPDDCILKKDITNTFLYVHTLFRLWDADAFRIMRKESKIKAKDTGVMLRDYPIRELTRTSMYIISYGPNLWKKSFLLKCLRGSNTIWRSELLGYRFRMFTSHRLQLPCKVYECRFDDWFVGIMRHGNILIPGWVKNGDIYEEDTSVIH